jgi:hypothetical protein
MKIAIRAVALIICVPVCLLGQGDRGTARIYKDESLGFSLTPPAFRVPPDAAAVQVAAFAGAPVDGFAVNLNVQIHNRVNLDAFIKTSEAQFKALGVEVLGSRDTKVGSHRAREYVYRMTLAGKAMRFIGLAAEDGDHVVLLTATSLDSQFNTYEAQFRAALASFKFDK